MIGKSTHWIVLLGLALFAIVVRAQTFNNPVLGFDEQFYLLVGDRMLHGALPYVDIFDRKPIGLFLIFAGARELGGDGFLQYKLVALGFVVATACLIYRAARQISNAFAACVAACLYLLWLNFMEGEGGQAEVFINLPMMAAALVTWRAVETRERIIERGAAAMLLVGIALQIKYSVVFEGVFFGIMLLWTRYRTERRIGAIVAPALLWIGLALLPTVLAALYYWHRGAFDAFFFANFGSIFGKHTVMDWGGLAVIVGIMTPLALLALPSLRKRAAETHFLKLWIAVALTAMLAYRAFGSPHYGIPVVAPLAIATAPFFAQLKRPKLIALVIVALFFAAGQFVLAKVRYDKGGLTEAQAVAAAAQPHQDCIYVYDGYPALYMLTHSCLPSRWVFPGHLDTQDESSANALGVDPTEEVRRILAKRPEVIIDDAPRFGGGNRATAALVEAALARDYRLARRQQTGAARFRLVYRLK